MNTMNTMNTAPARKGAFAGVCPTGPAGPTGPATAPPASVCEPRQLGNRAPEKTPRQPAERGRHRSRCRRVFLGEGDSCRVESKPTFGRGRSGDEHPEVSDPPQAGRYRRCNQGTRFLPKRRWSPQTRQKNRRPFRPQAGALRGKVRGRGGKENRDVLLSPAPHGSGTLAERTLQPLKDLQAYL